MLTKAVATVSGFASNAFRSEFSDWIGPVEWVKSNPARLNYGMIGLWLSVYVFLSHQTTKERFLAEYQTLGTGDTVIDLLLGIWMLACMFSFFSERSGAKWLRRSLVVLFSSGWVIGLWDVGMIGVVWIALAWMVFVVAEHAVAALDEASRRIRSLKYFLFTVAGLAAQSSAIAVLLLNIGNFVDYWPLFLFLWVATVGAMIWAYRDRSDPQGAANSNRAICVIAGITVLVAGVLSQIIEIAFGIPADHFYRGWWIQENWGVSKYLARLLNFSMTCGLVGIAGAMTWLGYRLVMSRFNASLHVNSDYPDEMDEL